MPQAGEQTVKAGGGHHGEQQQRPDPGAAGRVLQTEGLQPAGLDDGPRGLSVPDRQLLVG